MTQVQAERKALWRILAPVAEDLGAVERLLHSLVAGPGDHDWLGTTGSALLDAGGKRLRPALVLLCARAGEYDPEVAVPAAAALELLHLASLVHDDVIDRGTLRRGFPTVNSRWGDALAILTGDYLFGKALLAVSALPSAAVRQMGGVIGELVGGEVDQQLGRGKKPGLDEYLNRIGRKTAALLATSCRMGAVLGRVPEAVAARLGEYGWWLGLTYQVVDDLLDVCGDPTALGKAVGLDAGQGIATLPSLLTVDEAREMASDFSRRATSGVGGLKPDWLGSTLAELAHFLVERGS